MQGEVRMGLGMCPEVIMPSEENTAHRHEIQNFFVGNQAVVVHHNVYGPVVQQAAGVFTKIAGRIRENPAVSVYRAVSCLIAA